MDPELMDFLSVGVAVAALFVTALHSPREVMHARLRDLPGEAREFLWRSGTTADGSEPGAGVPTSEREGAPEDAEADRSRKQETHDVPAPRGGKDYDPRPLEDKARRRIAYLLIALLALQVTGLLTMVLFGVITVGDVKEFGVIVGPLVALVSAATGFYFATKRN